ncbi:MAG: polysaccharide deacetylase family protein [Planctomycetia bacterium]|nr:polysaccharide deacetylase family protein [Planctomycetia bacterium]
MSVFCLVGAFFSASSLVSLSADEWRRYEQEFVVEFATEQEAAQATAQALELPPGKTLAISSRWDDTNNEHLLMTKTLRENGWKGTFLLNGFNDHFVANIVEPILADGNSVGVHTFTHPHLETVSINRTFYELLGNRVDIETRTNSCVSSMTFPFGLRDTDNPSLSTAAEQGEAIRRAGILGGGEYATIAEIMGLSVEEFISTHLIRANDRDPNAEQFAREFENAKKRIAEGKNFCGPIIALGVHSWQRKVHADGFDRLSKIIATESNKAEYWYCNADEYIAYRMEYLNSAISKVRQEGTRVTFRVSRIMPFELGRSMEMGIRVSPAPTKVATKVGASERLVELCDNGEFLLPHAEGQRSPARIVLARNLEGVKISATTDLSKNERVLTITNESDKYLTNFHITTRLPLLWKVGIHREFVEKIATGESISLTLPLGEREVDQKYLVDDLFVVIQCDFEFGDEQVRAYYEEKKSVK